MEGFKVYLSVFCSYCGEFEPEVGRTEISSCGDSTRRFATDIHCVNEAKCLHIASALKEKLEHGQF